jgi:hypothetical protein
VAFEPVDFISRLAALVPEWHELLPAHIQE